MKLLLNIKLLFIVIFLISCNEVGGNKTKNLLQSEEETKAIEYITNIHQLLWKSLAGIRGKYTCSICQSQIQNKSSNLIGVLVAINSETTKGDIVPIEMKYVYNPITKDFFVSEFIACNYSFYSYSRKDKLRNMLLDECLRIFQTGSAVNYNCEEIFEKFFQTNSNKHKHKQEKSLYGKP